jgi:hypothetical protein
MRTTFIEMRLLNDAIFIDDLSYIRNENRYMLGRERARQREREREGEGERERQQEREREREQERKGKRVRDRVWLKKG